MSKPAARQWRLAQQHGQCRGEQDRTLRAKVLGLRERAHARELAILHILAALAPAIRHVLVAGLHGEQRGHGANVHQMAREQLCADTVAADRVQCVEAAGEDHLDTERRLAAARRMLGRCIDQNLVPIFLHILYTHIKRFASSSNESERRKIFRSFVNINKLQTFLYNLTFSYN